MTTLITIAWATTTVAVAIFAGMLVEFLMRRPVK